MKSQKRDIKLSEYNISKAKYLELKYFCMQYREKRKELENIGGIRGVSSDGQPKGKSTGNPTEQIAIRRMMLEEDIKLVEQTAIEADSEIYKYIIKNVTEGIAYEYMDVPMSRTKFYDSRRYFFFLLSRKK